MSNVRLWVNRHQRQGESIMHKWWEWWTARPDKNQRLMTGALLIAAILLQFFPPDASKLRGVGFGLGMGVLFMTGIWRPGSR